MSKIVYFVVGVDLDTKEVFIDDDVLQARFDKEGLYDTEKQEWRKEDYDSEYLPALELINNTKLKED